MANVPVFISFDYDHDDDLRVLLLGQAKNPDSPFNVVDWSIKEAAFDWKDKARLRIRRAEQVIVICGNYTNTASGIDVEIAIARDERRPYFLLAGRANGNNKSRPARCRRTKSMTGRGPTSRRSSRAGVRPH